MKKGLLFAFALVAVLFSFSSCDQGVDSTVSVKLDKDTVAVKTAITGTISTTGGDLVSVALLKDGTTMAGYPITSFSTGIVTGKSPSYTIRIDSLPAGNYAIKAIGQKSVESTKNFVVKAPVVLPTLTPIASNLTIYCTLGTATTKSTCASVDGTTYAPLNLDAASQTKVDFVYFNPSNTSPTLFAPSAVPNVIANALTGWTTKNATVFAKTTSIAYETADYTSVSNALATATDNFAKDLKVNDVVLFKTASKKIGILKVISVTGGSGSTDNIQVSFKVQQ